MAAAQISDIDCSITQEDTNYLRLSILLLKIVPRAIRHMFNIQNDPNHLSAKLQNKKGQLKLLLDRKIITKPQWQILYPQYGVVNSSVFDITLMVTLLRELNQIQEPSTGWNNLPAVQDISDGADLARYKYYRNMIVHNSTTSISNYEFLNIWTDISKAVERTGGQMFKKEVDALYTCSLDRRESEIILELKQLKIETVATAAELENLRKETILNNKGVYFNAKIKTWTKEDVLYLDTRASEDTLTLINSSDCVIIRGYPGSGKSAIAHHIALTLQTKGYVIFPIISIKDILDLWQPSHRQVFILDDPLGVHRLNEQEFDLWLRLEGDIVTCRNQSDMKIIITIRNALFENAILQELPPFFRQADINLQDKANRLTQLERQQLFEKQMTAKEKDVTEEMSVAVSETDLFCFPLMCRLYASAANNEKGDLKYFLQPKSGLDETIKNIKLNQKCQYALLVLCVVNNNAIYETELKTSNVKLNTLLTLLGEARCITSEQVEFALKGLLDVLLIKEGDRLTFIHDIVFDVVIASIPSENHTFLIKNCSSSFMRERLLYTNDTCCEGYVAVNSLFVTDLCERMIQEINRGELENVFLNKSFQNLEFQEFFVNSISEFSGKDTEHFCNQTSSAVQIIKKTVGDFMETFNKYDRHLFQPTASSTWRRYKQFRLLQEDGCSAFHWIVGNGLGKIFNFLWKRISKQTKIQLNKAIPLLPLATVGGNVDILKFLYDSGLASDGDGSTKSNSPSLVTAASYGDLQMVETLIDYCSVDIDCESYYYKSTALSLSCQNGHFDCVVLLIKKGASLNGCNDECKPLISAVSQSHFGITLLLLYYGADPNIRNSSSEAPLHAAARIGDVSIIDMLLDFNADINIQDNDGETPLNRAATSGDVSIIDMLLDFNADINIQDNDGVTPLHCAATSGDVSIIDMLLDFNADINIQDNDGVTPLHCAATSGDVSIIDMLLDFSADINIQDNDGDTPLHHAAGNGHDNAVRKLIEYGAKINQKEINALTPLIYATQEGHDVVVKTLIGSGADINQTDDDGNTPLLHSVTYGQDHVLRLLLDKGADVNIHDKNDISPLRAGCEDGHIKVVETLLDFGVDVNYCPKYRPEGATALMMCAYKNRLEIAELLLRRGANINQRRSDGTTAIYIAAQHADVEFIDLLLCYGAFVNDCRNDKCSPLIVASCNGKVKNVEKLIEKEADINNNEYGYSALWRASNMGHLTIVEILVKHGADINIRSKTGLSPVKIARENGHKKVVEFLQTHLKSDRLTCSLS